MPHRSSSYGCIFFNSWDLFKMDQFGRAGRIAMRISGLLLFTIFVGTIHSLFWAKFLHTVDPDSSLGIIFIIVISVSGYLHILVWRKKGGDVIHPYSPFYSQPIPALLDGIFYFSLSSEWNSLVGSYDVYEINLIQLTFSLLFCI